MERLAVPWLFVGPSGSGKLSEARTTIERAHGTSISLPLETKILPVGDGYEARIFTSPYHFEIDIPTLSMQDKQIIADLLTTFFASTDVFHALRSSSRKLVILRRAHSLSLPAAQRVRAILHQYVFPPDAVGMIWMTAREITGPLALLLDGFCVKRIPRMTFAAWSAAVPVSYKTKEAYEATEGRVDRAMSLAALFPTGCSSYPRRLQDYYDELIACFLKRAPLPKGTAPSLAVFPWIRSCVYQLLSFCQTGPEIIDCCAAALERAFAKEPHPILWRLMTTLSAAEPHTSYRTPLALEMMLISLYEDIRLGLDASREATKGRPVLADAPLEKKRTVSKKPKKAVNTVVLHSS
jgi:hypothetical protein